MEGPKFKNHIERLKFKIREMVVKRIETEALLKASEDRLASQQHTIDSNALLLQSLQMEQTNVQAEKVALNLALENNGLCYRLSRRNRQLCSLIMLLCRLL